MGFRGSAVTTPYPRVEVRAPARGAPNCARPTSAYAATVFAVERSAMSASRSRATIWPENGPPRRGQIEIFGQPATTCALVANKPSLETKNPVPLLSRPAGGTLLVPALSGSSAIDTGGGAFQAH